MKLHFGTRKIVGTLTDRVPLRGARDWMEQRTESLRIAAYGVV